MVDYCKFDELFLKPVRFVKADEVDPIYGYSLVGTVWINLDNVIKVIHLTEPYTYQVLFNNRGEAYVKFRKPEEVK